MKIKHKRFLQAIPFLGYFLFCTMTINAQAKQKEFYPMNYTKWTIFIPGNDLTAPFYVSAKPVTNKEYILFLVWTSRVFSDDYPELLYDVLPGYNSKLQQKEGFNPFSDAASFQFYLKNSDSYVADYIFNPAYLQYPVIGVNWEQANKFCYWLSDRYNEYSLIKKKFLSLDLSQKNDNNFTTESFIYLQYVGIVDKYSFYEFFPENPKKGFDFIQYLMRPSFHVASRNELQICAKMSLPTATNNLYQLVRDYSTEGSEFLEIFYQYFLPEDKGYIYISNPDKNDATFLASKKPSGKMKLPEKFSEWCLDSYLPVEEKNIQEVYYKYGYEKVEFLNPTVQANVEKTPQKDQLGKMPFLILGENNAKEFEIVKVPDKEKTTIDKSKTFIYDNKKGEVVNGNGDIFTCFRYAVNAIKK
jgi:hypothetical protein